MILATAVIDSACNLELAAGVLRVIGPNKEARLPS